MTRVPRGLWRIVVIYPARIITLAVAIIGVLNEFDVTNLSQSQSNALTTLVAATIVIIAGLYDHPEPDRPPEVKESILPTSSPTNQPSSSSASS